MQMKAHIHVLLTEYNLAVAGQFKWPLVEFYIWRSHNILIINTQCTVRSKGWLKEKQTIFT